IPDAVANAFWTNHYLDLNTVGFDQFVQDLYKDLGTVLPQLDIRRGGPFTDDERKLFLLREFVTIDKEHTTVDITRFGQVVQWIGGLEIPAPADNSMLDRFVELIKHPWFHGLVDASQAENLTRNKPTGSYLVRFSLRTPGGYTITVNQTRSGVNHLIVYNTPGKGFSMDNVHFWPSVPHLVAALASSFELQQPCSDNAWQFLWQGEGCQVGGYNADYADQQFETEEGFLQGLAPGSSGQ
ncbi:MAG: SH2 domain-containing protein, partial [archaeon]|nr:SH2 domain-containing protein [archaeon]